MAIEFELIPKRGWIELVGEEFEATFLDSPALRSRSGDRPPSLQRPVVCKISTPDGRVYKLLSVPKGNDGVSKILKNIRIIHEEYFVPELLWSDQYSLLFEYIVGDSPDITTPEFAGHFARAMARLHDYRCRDISSIKYWAEFHYNLSTLLSHNLIEQKHGAKCKALFYEYRPKYIRRSMDYFDIKSGNFIEDLSGTLRLIDVGAYKRNRATGQFLASSSAFSEMDQPSFWHEYGRAGGDGFLFENIIFLQLFHYVMKAGQRARQFASVQDKSSAIGQRRWRRCVRCKTDLLNFLEQL